MKRLLSLLIVGLAILGYERSEPEETVAQASTKANKKSEDAPMAKESAWTWGYFFAAEDKASVKGLSGERKQSLTLYRVDRIASVLAASQARNAPGSKIVRVETASKLPSTDDVKAFSLLFHGLPQHLQYTSQAQRDKLLSRAEFPASKDTIAVVIPIRKSAEWWLCRMTSSIFIFRRWKARSAMPQSV